MEKLKKFIKKPLLCISIPLIIAGIVILIVFGSISHVNSTYRYKETFFGATVEANIQLKSNDDIIIETKTYGNFVEPTYEKVQSKYFISQGKLYTLSEETGKYEQVGEVSAYKIKLKDNDMELSLNLKNSLSYTFMAFAIVFLVLGSIGLATSVTFIYLSKKKTSPPQPQVNEEIEE